MAFDFDDYMFMCHGGHSGVLVPLHIGQSVGADGRDIVCAMVCANELAGRLGAAGIIGPLNGQLMAYVHAGAPHPDEVVQRA